MGSNFLTARAILVVTGVLLCASTDAEAETQRERKNAKSIVRVIKGATSIISQLTPELTGRAHTAFNTIGGDNDERDTIERSG